MELPFLVYTVVAALFFAKLEIQIEGEHGWAAKLPTWRVEEHPLLELFFGGRPLTGYHLWAFLFVFLTFHVPFFFDPGSWALRRELHAIGGYSLFWIVEDVLWFVLNPHFGWRKFTRENVWWHKRWLLGFPADYWVMGTLSVALLSV
ncbi:MAG TPA: hypothetical protein VIG29_05780 [Vicinamibacteria bacterium]|jgi:hypothetical protein